MLISLYIAIYIGTIDCRFAEHECKFREVPFETGIPKVKVTLAQNSCHWNVCSLKLTAREPESLGLEDVLPWKPGRFYVSFRECILWSFVHLVLNKLWRLVSSKNMNNMFPSEVMTETYRTLWRPSVLVDFSLTYWLEHHLYEMTSQSSSNTYQ